MMFWYDHDMGWWGYAGMGIGMLLFWALIIVGIVALVRFSSGSTRAPRGNAASPEQLLAALFARGEINGKQYGDDLAVLRDHLRR